MQTAFSTGRRDTAPPGYLGGRQYMIFICSLVILIIWSESVLTVSVVHYHTSGLPSFTIRSLTGTVTVPLCGHLWLPWLESLLDRTGSQERPMWSWYLKAHLPRTWHWLVCSIQHYPLSSLKLLSFPSVNLSFFHISTVFDRFKVPEPGIPSTDQIPPTLQITCHQSEFQLLEGFTETVQTLCLAASAQCDLLETHQLCCVYQ